MSADLHALFVAASLRQPWLGVATSLLLAVGATSALLPIFSLSDPESGQLIRDTRLADEAHSLLRATQLASDSFKPKNESFQPQQTRTLDELYLYYVAGRTASEDVERSGDVLSVETLQRIAELEDRILAAANWSDVCKRAEGSNECEPFKSAVPLLREATDADAVVEARALLDDEWHFGLNASGQHEPRSSYVMRTAIRFGAPLRGFVSENDRREEQRKALTDRFLRPLELEVLRPTVEAWNELEALSLLYNNHELYILQFNRILGSDTLLFGWSIGCLYLLMLIHMRSPFLALAGLFQEQATPFKKAGLEVYKYRLHALDLCAHVGSEQGLGDRVGLHGRFSKDTCLPCLRSSSPSLSRSSCTASPSASTCLVCCKACRYS